MHLEAWVPSDGLRRNVITMYVGLHMKNAALLEPLHNLKTRFRRVATALIRGYDNPCEFGVLVNNGCLHIADQRVGVSQLKGPI